MGKKVKTLPPGRASRLAKAMRDEKPMKRRVTETLTGITIDQPSPGANAPPVTVSGSFTSDPAPTIIVSIVIGTNPQQTVNGTVTVTGNTWTFTPNPGSPALPLNTPLTLIVSDKDDPSSYTTVAFTLTGPTFTGVTTNSSEAIVTVLGIVAPGTNLAVYDTTSFKMVGPDPVTGNFAVTSYLTATGTLRLVVNESGKKMGAGAFNFNILGPDTLTATATPSLDANSNQLLTVSYSQLMADTAFVAANYTLLDPKTGNPPLDGNGNFVTITAAAPGSDPTTAVLTLSAPPATGTYNLTIGTEDVPVTDEAGNDFTANPVAVSFP